MGLIEAVLSKLDDKKIDDLRIGSAFVGVRIGPSIGLAHRVESEAYSVNARDDLIGTKAASLILSKDPLEAAIATAAMNAQITPVDPKFGNIFELILKQVHQFKTIGVVGKFPIIDRLRAMGCKVHAFEKKNIPGFLPADRVSELLPDCDLVVITGTAFVNKTLEQLLMLSNGFTMVIGPTTVLSPVLFDFSADILAGVDTQDAHVLDVIASGGGTREFKQYVNNVYMEAHRNSNSGL